MKGYTQNIRIVIVIINNYFINNIIMKIILMLLTLSPPAIKKEIKLPAILYSLSQKFHGPQNILSYECLNM